MNIYEKLQIIRCQLQKEPLKKSGENTYAGYEYFELQDFLPRTNELMLENKITSIISFGIDMAVLTIIDIEKPEDKLLFTSPMSEATLKGCHAVQNLGAVQTYLRRYLYIAAFEIVENDNLDSITGKDKTAVTEDKKSNLSDAQVKRAYAIATSVNISNEDVKKWIMSKYKKTSMSDLSKKEYDELVSSLEAKKTA